MCSICSEKYNRFLCFIYIYIFIILIIQQFSVPALTLAMSRDGSSGGVVRLGIINEEGIERRTVLGNELPRFYEG